MDSVLEPLAEFAPGRLLEDPRAVDSGIYLYILGFFVVIFLVGLALSLMPAKLARGHRLHQRLFALYGVWSAWLAGSGLAVVGLRYVSVPLFSKRIWTLLSIIAVLGVLAHAAWYRLTRYPDDLADYQEEQRRRRYIPTPGRRRRR